jgi:hypothetical protein
MAQVPKGTEARYFRRVVFFPRKRKHSGFVKELRLRLRYAGQSVLKNLCGDLHRAYLAPIGLDHRTIGRSDAKPELARGGRYA